MLRNPIRGADDLCIVLRLERITGKPDQVEYNFSACGVYVGQTLCHCDIGALDYKFPSNNPRDVWVRGTYCSSVFSDYQGQEKLCVGVDRDDLDYNGRSHETYGHWTAIRSVAHSNHGSVDCR